MEATMELDDLKHAWQTLDRRLEQQHTRQFQQLRAGKLDTLRRRLRPLVWGQTAQLLFGIVLVLASGMFWTAHRDQLHLLVAGIVMHAYGIGVIIISGITHGRLSRIDYAAPVLEIQKQLANLRRLYVIGGMCVGLPWWLLWLPAAMMTLKALFGADLYTNVPGLVWINLAVGTAGLLATAWFHRWSQHPARPRLARIMENSLTGASLRNAQAVLDEVRRFEQD